MMEDISIHVPREGHDFALSGMRELMAHFYPRAP